MIIYIGGEGPLGGTAGGMVATLARERGALQLALEHRYYGESFPAPLSDKVTMTTLHVETALEDLSSFIIAQKASLGFTGKVLVVGGSYPGALSAWFRLKYPEIADASWSSSGVVNAVYNFTGFDAQVLADVDPECVAALHGVTAAFDAAWDAGGARKSALLALFGTPSYWLKGDMAWMLADSAGMAVQYGTKAALCSALLPVSKDPLAQFAAFTKAHYGANFPSSCYYSTRCLSSPSMSDQWIAADYQWVYQCCRELAYWQVAYDGSQRSAAVTLDYYNEQCQAAFGFDPKTSGANAAFNAKFGGATPDSSNTIALNGGDDPWQRAAVESSLSPDYPELTAVCDGCGHCGDLSAPRPDENAAITAQHNAIRSYAQKWLGK
jgi:pimeloyl-ACP methyl ester carboxylesterase